jgi:hypothetical protein
MKKIKFFIDAIKNYFNLIFLSAADNHIKFEKKNIQHFKSYYQLKKHQINLRRVSLKILFALMLIVSGMLIGPLFFSTEKKAVIYIPNGRGDILISNASKGQTAIIFKTLDAAKDNAPLATTAEVAIYADAERKNFIKKTEPHEFAVTHVIPLEGLQEGESYFIEIKVATNTNFNEAVTEALWSNQEPIKVVVRGDETPPCSEGDSTERTQASLPQADGLQITSVSGAVDAIPAEIFDLTETAKQGNSKLVILDVANENHLYGKEKIQTIISWMTNFPANSALLYREARGGEFREVAVAEGRVKKHGIVLMTLKPATDYYFKIKALDDFGNTAVSEEYSLRTPPAKEMILDVIAENGKSLMKQIGL